ncbi:MAG TPA: hypothetical protein VNO35_24230 [Steroidobacteraceae bacterium]|nr:hypothetical protein [Steroidobacteraceae bacterium]
MTELHRALAEINAIRNQVARGTQFRGYGPRTVAASGVLALIVAALQARWSAGSGHDATGFVEIWAAVAAVSAGFSAWETISRSRRVHVGFAREMINSAVEQFLPALAVGMLLTVVLLRCAPQALWMLPGLWQISFSLGIFASCRFLPRPMFAVGLWYLAAGLVCLVIESGPRELYPWAMGIPFGVGQLLVALTLEHGYEESVEER